jgi:hypothetical protein
VVGALVPSTRCSLMVCIRVITFELFLMGFHTEPTKLGDLTAPEHVHHIIAWASYSCMSFSFLKTGPCSGLAMEDILSLKSMTFQLASSIAAGPLQDPSTSRKARCLPRATKPGLHKPVHAYGVLPAAVALFGRHCECGKLTM